MNFLPPEEPEPRPEDDTIGILIILGFLALLALAFIAI
jgi:hypothetical protein